MSIIWTGYLHKLKTNVNHDQVNYFLHHPDHSPLHLNKFVGKKIKFSYLSEIKCVNCSRMTKKSFQQGHCFPCSQKLASCDICMVKPERCHFSEGTCREPDWGLKECFQPHYVYLANSSGLKVGITRESQVPHRWMDQGAVAALPIIKVKDRKSSGLVEVLISQSVADKSDWRKLITQDAPEMNLIEERDKILKNLSSLEIDHEVLNDEIKNFIYPIKQYPSKAKSLNLEKSPVIESELLGIKGQYLFFTEGALNIRNFSGHKVEIQEI